MKSFVLIAFIISNLLFVSLATAASAINVEIQTHEHIGSHDPYNHKQTLNDFDDSKCNHLCHFSMHLMGFISQYSVLPIVNLAVALPITNESFPSLVLDPPFQPPQA